MVVYSGGVGQRTVKLSERKLWQCMDFNHFVGDLVAKGYIHG